MKIFDGLGNDVTLEFENKILLHKSKIVKLEKENKRLKKKLEKCNKPNCC